MDAYGTSKEFLTASCADLRSIARAAVDRSGDIARNLGGPALGYAREAVGAANALEKAAGALWAYLEDNGMADPE